MQNRQCEGVIELIAETYGFDDDNNHVVTGETMTEVFCTVKSVRQSEFYQAATADLKPEVVFEIRRPEYDGQTALIFECDRYEVIRTFGPDVEKLEIVCKKLIAATRSGASAEAYDEDNGQ